MQTALYGPGGFYTQQAPAAHFRTSVHASPLFAAAIHRLARAAGLRTIVDVGAGRGEFLGQVHTLDPTMRLHGVDVVDRPVALPPDVTWSSEVPVLDSALVVANEWLDTIPLDVVTHTDDGPRLVLVDTDGTERVGPPPEPADAAWLARWWPEVGHRAEIGRTRDEAWAGVVGRLRHGIAVAVDYGHRREARPPQGTLSAYRGGRQVPPVPDGSCDLTAHVALDSCLTAPTAHIGSPGVDPPQSHAGEPGGCASDRRSPVTASMLLTQRDALRQLGVTGGRPPRELASRDPISYLRALEQAGQAAELTDPAGLGGFGWVVHALGVPIPFR